MSNTNSFSWSITSATRKLLSGITVSVAPLGMGISKQITDQYNPKTDAYRACSNCGQHYNYHAQGCCPAKK